MTIRKTKIVATVGPACIEKEILKEMMLAGVNVFRLNFSHGTHKDHKLAIDRIEELNDELGMNVALLADLGGPKLRLREAEDNLEIETGDEITISTTDKKSSGKTLYISYSQFANDVVKGDKILIDDGKIELKAISSNKKDTVKAEVIFGGIVKSRKGVNLPNTKISLPSLTENDKKDLQFALKSGVHWVALSFVRSARDVIELKHIIQQQGSEAKVISKIEKPQAVKEIKDIIKHTDAIMVARGDLGVEIPMQDVPILQKSIVIECQKQAKPVIIATQMMESMIDSIRPTRAEVNDVGNAVMDGADAVMLSGETSVGQFPVEVIETMAKIVHKTESYQGMYNLDHEVKKNTDRTLSDSICDSACRLAQQVDASAIITMTFSGYTAFKIASYRPKAGIYVFTSNKKILNMLNLLWGVKGLHYDKFVSTDHTIDDIKYRLQKRGFIREGDFIVNIASMPINERGMTNMLRLTQVD